VDPTIEHDWSGHGQHVEFYKHKRDLLPCILEVQNTLGRTRTAVVESVGCKRILLARKTLFCNRHFTKEQAMEEVAHLTRLNHAHIVAVIGTYTLGKELSILMYPVAEYKLDEFLHKLSHPHREDEQSSMRSSANVFFTCLSSALHHVHHNLVKTHGYKTSKHLSPQKKRQTRNFL
jgi:hypothetical protein